LTPQDLRAAYRALFNTDDGQVVLEDLEARFHIHRPVFSTEANETAFRDGQRSVVLMIQGWMRDDPRIQVEVEEIPDARL
tara:strand:- start:4448 stop:4687 length:240 start_codon:yes stop_codon:yes gene_type:complete